MIKKEGKFPVNARVDIDYSGKKPKIKFGYTSKNPRKDSIKQHTFGFHTMIIMLILYFVFVFAMNYPIEGNYPEQCSNVTFDEKIERLNLSIDFEEGELYRTTIFNRTYKKVITGANMTCDGEIYQVKFLKDTTFWELREGGFYHKTNRSDNFPFIYSGYILSILFLFIVLGYYLNKLVTHLLLKSERYRKGFPKFQAKLYSKRRYMKFKPKDVENKMVEIPCFSNIVLEYKADGDFSKQLQRIKIREHTHHEFKKGKPSKEIKRDIFSWYVRFFFKETPKDGYLEVIYR